ncbi:hypothetical protein BUALT_Bualt07G0032900 [Buddleja alternifolia]|uniref:Uncharacterized protein n=1 Tax=Buddleja alternifolia TaxID=168488 RepID=A0AAV6X8Q9_9LAMI|nr:hypothetical protein BUALT_Bualt07G0032900 [Buddleja alternifolia]
MAHLKEVVKRRSYMDRAGSSSEMPNFPLLDISAVLRWPEKVSVTLHDLTGEGNYDYLVDANTALEGKSFTLLIKKMVIIRKGVGLDQYIITSDLSEDDNGMGSENVIVSGNISSVEEIVGFYFYGYYILNDPAICVVAKYVVVMPTVYDVKRDSIDARPFPFVINQRPTMFGRRQPEFCSSGHYIQEMRFTDMRFDTCLFSVMCNVVKNLIEELYSNLATSSLTYKQIHLSPFFGFLHQLDVEFANTDIAFDDPLSVLGLDGNAQGTATEAYPINNQ